MLPPLGLRLALCSSMPRHRRRRRSSSKRALLQPILLGFRRPMQLGTMDVNFFFQTRLMSLLRSSLELALLLLLCCYCKVLALIESSSPNKQSFISDIIVV